MIMEPKSFYCPSNSLAKTENIIAVIMDINFDGRKWQVQNKKI